MVKSPVFQTGHPAGSSPVASTQSPVAQRQSSRLLTGLCGFDSCLGSITADKG
jgi:hypothetical protein